MLNQQKMPFVEALEEYKKEHFVPFHTPGHKIGQEAPPILKSWMGHALPYDLGVMYALDDLHEPEGALLEAEQLAAQLYGADYTWFSINGTTSLIETMIMGTVSEGEEILIPREAHRSVISGLILSGAKPIYMTGRYNKEWGVTLGTTPEEVELLILQHPLCKTILLVNPNYYGISLDIEKIITIAHKYGLTVLVDEAHGAHLKFCKELPISALEAGADLVAQSTHKLVGSLTQTSMLHMQGNRVDERRVTQVFQMLQSTSPNYIFLASLDMARHQLATSGEELLKRTLTLARYLRSQLTKIKGINVLTAPQVMQLQTNKKEMNYAPIYLDETKVLIDFSELGLDGKAAELLLREEKIEVELVSGNHVLVLITIGDTIVSIEALVEAVKNISRKSVNQNKWIRNSLDLPLPIPKIELTPRQAFFRKKEKVNLLDALGRVSGETITYYPPGIPFVSMGEVISQEVIDFINYKKEQGFVPNGAADRDLYTIQVMQEDKNE